MAWNPRGPHAAAPEWPSPARATPPAPAWPGAGNPPALPARGDAPGLTPPSPAPGHPLGPMRGGFPAANTPAAPLATPAWPGAQAAPAPSTATGWGASSLGMDATQAAGLSYCGWWLTGIVIYFSERQSRYVRFHAFQSIVLTGGLTIFGVLAYVLASLLQEIYRATAHHAFHTLAVGVALLAFVSIVLPWLFVMGAAFAGYPLRIPYIARYAERYAPPTPPDYSAFDDKMP